MGIRAVVTDIDGTIAREDGSVTSATLQASRELAANGIPLIAATARVPAGLASLRPEIPAFTAAVCCNGSLGVDMRNDRSLWQQELRPAAVARIVSALISRLPDVGLAAFDGSGWKITANYLAIRGRRPRAPSRLTSPAELAGAAALALSVCHPSMEAEQLAAELAEAGTTPDDAVLTYGDTRLLDIAPPGVDKASGVARVLEMLGVAPEQTVAFGDAPNDPERPRRRIQPGTPASPADQPRANPAVMTPAAVRA